MTICIRKAHPDHAEAIARVHVASWRSTYPGILPDAYLAGLSVPRLAAIYRRGLVQRRDGEGFFVALARPDGTPAGDAAELVVGFASCGRLRELGASPRLGEIATLYVLDDWRDQGLGRRLVRAAAAHLAAIGCDSARLCVLSENPALWFYQRLGGRIAARETIRVGGKRVEQTAMLWDPIALLLDATARADGA